VRQLTCTICGADISHRNYRAVYCEECAEKIRIQKNLEANARKRARNPKHRDFNKNLSLSKYIDYIGPLELEEQKSFFDYYIDSGRNLKKMSDSTGVEYWTLKKWKNRHGIPTGEPEIPENMFAPYSNIFSKVR